MEIYLVGGAVRDQLLNLPVKDRDWVVVGATPEMLNAAGYRQVGRDFPVFLHPQTGEEYALARQERKISAGHHGFFFNFSPTVSLEDDLLRRDLTINAMAQSLDGKLIDPYGGQKDMTARILRHVSPAFCEDPLRVLRLFRFWARFYHLGFHIAPETLALCREIVIDGELATLSGDRIWQECEKALSYASPQYFFSGLFDIGALQTITADVTPDINILTQMNLRLAQACSNISEVYRRLAIWTWGQESVITAMHQKLPIPNRYIYWMRLVNSWGDKVLRWQTLSADERWQFLKACGGLRDFGDVSSLMTAVGVLESVIQSVYCLQQRIQEISTQKFIAQGITGKALGAAIKAEQLALLS